MQLKLVTGQLADSREDLWKTIRSAFNVSVNGINCCRTRYFWSNFEHLLVNT
ncbi:hypothetical protein P5673_008132 [Acropora cervicornis]|uniref:Uncharacterized protein n=1 Tax=Acropora cervicornis TaxID=6130 RepID=A0AAD9QTL8_ACRCE|nr:hypothetical protein P5673_008132 [Acropora cervicornis]